MCVCARARTCLSLSFFMFWIFPSLFGGALQLSQSICDWKATSAHCPCEFCSHNVPWCGQSVAYAVGITWLTLEAVDKPVAISYLKRAASGSSCDHTGSVSTTCLTPNGDYYYRRFSLTFSKIETESLVLFTKNNQEYIGNRCASDF